MWFALGGFFGHRKVQVIPPMPEERSASWTEEPRPPGAAPHWHVHTGRARAPTGRRQARKQGCCIVRCAEPRAARGCSQNDSCAEASGAKEHVAKKLAAKIAGANILERARRGRCCREERKAVCTRHGEPARARPRPHARLGFGAGRRERGRFAHRCFALPAPAGRLTQVKIERLHLGKARQIGKSDPF